jgi:hypothetical protein
MTDNASAQQRVQPVTHDNPGQTVPPGAANGHPSNDAITGDAGAGGQTWRAESSLPWTVGPDLVATVLHIIDAPAAVVAAPVAAALDGLDGIAHANNPAEQLEWAHNLHRSNGTPVLAAPHAADPLDPHTAPPVLPLAADPLDTAPPVVPHVADPQEPHNTPSPVHHVGDAGLIDASPFETTPEAPHQEPVSTIPPGPHIETLNHSESPSPSGEVCEPFGSHEAEDSLALHDSHVDPGAAEHSDGGL